MKPPSLGVIPIVFLGLSLVLSSCKYEIQIGPVRAETEIYWGKGPIVNTAVNVPENGGNVTMLSAYYGFDGVNPFAFFSKGSKYGP